MAEQKKSESNKAAPIDPNHLDNCTYFILPCRILSPEKLNGFLRENKDWAEVQKGFQTQYLLFYASGMNLPADERFRRYRHRAPQTVPLYLFQDQLAGQQKKDRESVPSSGCGPEVGGISLYVFGSGIAFLEIQVLYGDMNAQKIVSFVNLFRSLRFDESKPQLQMQPGEISLKTAAERLLPAAKSGTVLCFSNPSEIKQQAIVYSMLDVNSCGTGSAGDYSSDHCSFLLTHGYQSISPACIGQENTYEMQVCMKAGEYWRGSQDGMACVTEKPYSFQSVHLNVDYHFLYLLLLDQRFSAISYIEEMSRPDQTPDSIQAIHKKVVALKTRYSFRVVSDDFFLQTIYNGMYRVLEIDHLLEDLGEGNDQLAAVVQDKQEAREQRFNRWLSILSVLAIFSALIDLTDYISRIRSLESPLHAWISLAVNAVTIAVVCLLLHRRK